MEPQNGTLHFHREKRYLYYRSQKTVKKLDEAYNFIHEVAAEGGEVLFVGTKKQAADSIRKKHSEQTLTM